MKLTKSTGMLLLGIWLILTGLIPLLHLSFWGWARSGTAAGALILVGR